MYRWMEEVELVEEELRRLHRGCIKMKDIWERLATLNADSGYAPYAYHKADMYTQMAKDAKENLVAAGGGWPSDGQTLLQYLRSRRPKLDVDWSQSRHQVEATILHDSETSSSESEPD
jgi:hypothetical protein